MNIGTPVTTRPNKYWLRYGTVIETAENGRVRVLWSHETNGKMQREVGIRTWINPRSLAVVA